MLFFFSLFYFSWWNFLVNSLFPSIPFLQYDLWDEEQQNYSWYDAIGVRCFWMLLVVAWQMQFIRMCVCAKICVFVSDDSVQSLIFHFMCIWYIIDDLHNPCDDLTCKIYMRASLRVFFFKIWLICFFSSSFL